MVKYTFMHTFDPCVVNSASFFMDCQNLFEKGNYSETPVILKTISQRKRLFFVKIIIQLPGSDPNPMLAALDAKESACTTL